MNFKLLTTLLLLTIMFFVFSCDSKSETAQTTKTANKKANKTTVNSDNSEVLKLDYWQSLQAELKLKNSQVRNLKAIAAKYSRELKKLKKAKKVNKKVRKELRRKQDIEIKKLLGDKLFAQKKLFDTSLKK